MSSASQLALFLRNLATGILAPVLTLGLLAHGASIRTVSLLLGAYSLTVIVFEFPSGVFADVYGRKPAFLLSLALQFAGYGVFLASRSPAPLFAAMVLSGLGRAFSSGSIDALAIDEAERGGAELAGVTARISILESSGLAAGALLGGLLSGVGERYAGNLLANIAIVTLLFFLTLLRVRETPRTRAPEQRRGSRGTILEQAKSSLAFALRKGPARPLFALAFVTGFALLAVETYWQPAFAQADPPRWMFGVLSFAGFVCVMAGSKLAEYLLGRLKGGGFGFLLGVKALLGLGLAFLYTQMLQAGFILTYLLIYVFIGGGSVAENTLLNRAVPSSRRASVLSLFSFALQIGGLLASAAGFLVSSLYGFRAMWPVAGAVMVLSVSAYAVGGGKLRPGAAARPPDSGQGRAG